MDWEKLNSYLKISLIILNLFIINIITVFFSILSLGILTPALTGANYCEIEKILDYDMQGIYKRYFTNVKENLKSTIGKILLLQIFVLIVGISLFFLNPLVADNYNPTFYYFIVFTQILFLFEAFNILQIALILKFVVKVKNVNDCIKYGFLVINTNLGRYLLANISIVITIVLMTKLPIFSLIFISLTILLYYVSVKQTIYGFYENIKKI